MSNNDYDHAKRKKAILDEFEKEITYNLVCHGTPTGDSELELAHLRDIKERLENEKITEPGNCYTRDFLIMNDKYDKYVKELDKYGNLDKEVDLDRQRTELYSNIQKHREQELALINVVGKSRQGFEWNTGLKLVTNGIWFSQPFIVSKTNGQELAIILVDTQGLYDENYTQRDSSTIVGLSLLMTSALVFNVFNSLQEDDLGIMHSILEFGLEVVRSGQGDGASATAQLDKPFQNLI
ncbi:unnamed protein product [Oppiella nova]|uniref:Guanylate-binding protein N-terminal domain-containing protein n=1 Tax=Oppiella nova TaxID=334625 RepID=A0A7R9LJ39_9ACAR|nr:unnamed protein product [Oppiella nova]CAG2163494.1 unnamed protein product [Oppiella nova]